MGRVATPTTTPTATRSAASSIPAGLRISRPRPPAPGFVIAALVSIGLLLGAVATGGFADAGLVVAGLLLACGLAAARPALGLAALMLMAPLQLSLHIGSMTLLASEALIAALVVLWAGALLSRRQPSWRRSPLDLPVVIFIGVSAFSLAGLGPNLNRQLAGLGSAVAGVMVFFLVTQAMRVPGDVWVVLAGAFLAGVSQAAVITLKVLTGAQVVSEQTRVAGTLLDPNHFAGSLVLLIPLLLALGLTIRSRWAVAVTALSILMLTIALLATLSRSGWLGLLTGSVILAVWLPTARRRLALVVGSIVFVVMAAGLEAPIGARLAPHTLGPLEMLGSRWAVWTVAVGVIAAHPVIGVGIDNFEAAFAQASGWLVPVNHAHNIFLNMAAERGLLGMAAFSLVVFILFRTASRARRQSDDPIGRALAAGCIASFGAYFVHSLLDVSYYDVPVLLLFWVLAGVAASLPGLWRPADAPTTA